MNDSSATTASVESERAVLGAVLLRNESFDTAAEIISADDFYLAAHAVLWRCFARMIEAGRPVDIVTAFEELQARPGELAAVGGLPEINELAATTPSAANMRRYAQVVRDKAQRRRLQQVAVDLADSAVGPASVEAVIETTERRLAELADAGQASEVSLSDAMQEALSYIDDRVHSGSRLAGVTSGFAGIDRLTFGFEPGQLIVLAGRPSMGKTLLATNIASAAEAAGCGGVLWFSLEMPRREMALRELSARTGVPVDRMRGGQLDDEEMARLVAARTAADRRSWWIDDRSALTLAQVRARAKSVSRRQHLGLVVIDYIGLMSAGGDNRTQQLGAISRGLKALAKELRVPILALAQLNREVEKRTDRRPLMSDLRDSGEIEQDADLVLMIHRESVYSSGPEWEGLGELLVRKNRNGATGEALLHFRPEKGAFEDCRGPSPRSAALAARRDIGFSDEPRQRARAA